jgi:putative peptidoglycan lipid II flippase
VSKRTEASGLGSLAGAALTALSTLLVTAFAAVVGIVIAREFGRSDETDGFFAAYGVFIVIVLASQSIRIAVLPALARAREERRLAGSVAGFAVAIAVVGVPLLLALELAAEPIARLLTGGGSDVAADACAEALRWMVPAAVAHLFAGLAASGLAALDEYGAAALGYASGSAAGLALILVRVDPDGLVAVSRGMLLNGVVALLVPASVLAWKAWGAQMPAGAVRPAGQPLHARLGLFASAAALPLALQLLYVACLPFAGRQGSGAVTSFGYAYLLAASLVSVTAFSIGLVSSVPLTRAGLGPDGAARHVVSSTWVALTLIGPAVGVFALAGGGIVEAVLGDAYGGDIGTEVARLVVWLSPWTVASVGVNVAFPLAFVAERMRALPWIGAGALALQVLLAWAASELFELDGLALALALTTALVLAALLRELGALGAGARGVARAALVVAAFTAAAFVPPGLLLGAVAAALAGVAVYAALIAIARPAELTRSWAYLRALR